RVLKRLHDSKGSDYTEALALAIPRLSGEDRQKVRDTLALRLKRMSARTLVDYLKDSDPEIRAATSLAVAMKELREHVPLIVERREDPAPCVAGAAHAARKEMTKEDFGPAADATREEQARAVQAWKQWWKKQSQK